MATMPDGHGMRRAVRVAVVAALAGAALACGGSGQGAPTSPSGSGDTPPTAAAAPGASTAGVDAEWTTFGGSSARTGVAAEIPPAGPLGVAWRAHLDGAVYAQPITAAGLVIAATENDTLYGLDPASGAVRWQTHVGTPVPRSALPCGDIDPLGITGTPVYDPATGTVLAVAEVTGGEHDLVAVAAATGALTSRRPVDPPLGDRNAHQQRAALTLLDGRVYVPYGGLAGDCGAYVGSVVSAPVSGTGPLQSFHVPTSREGGIWATGGLVVRGDTLFAAVGNGAAGDTGGGSAFDGSDSVVALSPDLVQRDLFAPETWAADNDQDLDLGSMSPAVVGDHVIVAGKRGVLYVLQADHLGGLGGEVTQTQVCRAFGAAAVAGDVAYLPCADGTRAVRINADGSATVLWHTTAGTDGPPAVGGGVVWTVNRDSGTLFALDPATGAVRGSVAVGGVPHFPPVSLAGGHAYVATLDGVTAVAGA